MSSFGHDHQQDAVGAKTRCVVERLSNVGGGGVAHDEDVFTTAKVHAGVNHRLCTACHLFSHVRLIEHRVVHRDFEIRSFLGDCNPFGFVHDVLNVLVHRVVVLATRALSTEREDHGCGSVQMFLNVSIFGFHPCPFCVMVRGEC